MTAVQLVGNVADTAGKQLILHNKSIVIGDIVCPVWCACALKKFNNFPFEANDGLLTRALNKFRKAKDIYNPCWLHLNGVADGSLYGSPSGYFSECSKDSTVEQNTVNVEQSTSNILQSNNNVEQNIDVVVLSLGLNLYRPLKILLHKRILKK